MPHQESLQVVVIGAGQAGLSAAYNLLRRGLKPGRDFVVLDSNPGPGGAWRHRWPSLTLGKAHGIHDLPGLKLGTPDPTEPASAVVSRYYGAYENEFDLPILRPVRVTAVRSATGRNTGPLTVEGKWEHTELDFNVTTAAVINATGTWDQPYVPFYPGIDRFTGRQLHTKNYRSPQEFAGQTVAVVGGGASAVQFLLPLAQAGVKTVWSTRRAPVFGQAGMSG